MKRLASGLGLGLFALTILLPLVWMIATSLKTGPEIFGSPWGLPATPQWANFAKAWNEAGIGASFFNSIIATVGTLAILLPIGAMAAYVFALYPFRGSGILYGTFMGGLMVPQFLTIVPLFFLIQQMGLMDTRQGLIVVYVAYSLHFTVFVLTGFFQQLPKELVEAAMMDGAGHFTAFRRIMLPLARTGLLVVGIFNGIGLWNEYSLALVLLPGEGNRTLPLGIANLVMVEHYQSDWGALFAGLVIVMLPVVAVYWLFRDKIHEVMIAGAVKG
ncbi:MAG: carbohydrate ABC transporter permease [Fimbriimonas sp.]